MNYQFNWSVLWTGQSGQWLLSGLITTLELSALRVAARGGARHRVRRAPHRAASGRSARGRHVLRRVLPERPAAGVDVLLVLRGAAAPARRGPGVALRPRARVLGGGVRARRLQRRALLRGAPLRHPVHPAHPARGLGGLGAHHLPGLPLRDPARRAAAHHSARHQRVAEPAQELVGGAHHQRGRADVPDAADRDLHRQGHRGAHRGHAHLPGALRLPRLDHVLGRARATGHLRGARSSPSIVRAARSGAAQSRCSISTSSGATSRS